jgi:hypothetical protein
MAGALPPFGFTEGLRTCGKPRADGMDDRPSFPGRRCRSDGSGHPVYPIRFLIFAQEPVIKKLSSMSAIIRTNFFIGAAIVRTPSGT